MGGGVASRGAGAGDRDGREPEGGVAGPLWRGEWTRNGAWGSSIEEGAWLEHKGEGLVDGGVYGEFRGGTIIGSREWRIWSRGERQVQNPGRGRVQNTRGPGV